MLVSFNLTTYEEDLERYADASDLARALDEFGCDGVELMLGPNEGAGVIPAGRVSGVHLGYFTTWYDFWRGDEAGVLEEFGSLETAREVFGSLDPHCLVQRLKRELEIAHRLGAKYVVYHVSEARMHETVTFSYRRRDDEIIDAVCEIVNEAFADEDGSLVLLLENLWQPGLTLTNPEMTRRLLDGIAYENVGIMMDTGHLLHTNFDLATQDEGVRYIERMLDEHADLARFVRGMHLQQFLSGDLCRALAANPPAEPRSYQDKWALLFEYAFQVDGHRPFTSPLVEGLVERVAPEFLTFEFISGTREEHESLLREQWRALPALASRRGVHVD